MNKYQMAKCHPDRLHHAKGLCRKCYQAQYKRTPASIERRRKYAKKWSDDHRGLIRIKEREYYRKRPDLVRKYNLRKMYGLTPEQCDEILKRQGGVCPICKSSSPNFIDHDHNTGRIRGILCRQCNTALGFLRDDPQIALSATKYLELWRQ